MNRNYLQLKNLTPWFLIGLMLIGLISSLIARPNSQQAQNSARSRPQPEQMTEPEKIEAAQAVLLKYFSELHDGNFERAAEHYQGSYELLEILNPNEISDDPVMLFEDACNLDGFLCLNVYEITAAEKTAPHEYSFEVIFESEDGSIYKHRSSDGGFITEFPYTVIEQNGRFYVEQLPIHS